MSQFIIAPSNQELLDSLFWNSALGKYQIPVLTFNTTYLSPFIGEIDPLNDDPNYQRRVIDNFYMRLTEKWLYKTPIFRKLLKYFNVEEKGDEGKVSLITDPDKVNKNEANMKYRKHIFRYIEKCFITRKFVSKVLRRYVKTTGIKWYDLFTNTDTVKDLFAHKLKKFIISVIYELQDKKISK